VLSQWQQICDADRIKTGCALQVACLPASSTYRGFFAMRQHLTIITGASRGMGAAIAQQLVHAGHDVLALSRTHNQALPAPACEQWAVDLTEPAPVAEQLAVWLATQEASRFDSVTLINNAALLAPPGPLAAAHYLDVAVALRVGLEAPMLLTAAFLKATATWPGVRKVLNISSGLGRTAMAGSSSYCAAKAGLDHYARAVALEQADVPNGAKIVSLAPGVIATAMQVQLRTADPAQFPNRERFMQLHTQGQLMTPQAAAEKVIAYLQRADFGQNVVADVRQG
jgi:benzil reductase ((S)-benzoin forming)